jgi:cytoskeletal protein RodZ
MPRFSSRLPFLAPCLALLLAAPAGLALAQQAAQQQAQPQSTQNQAPPKLERVEPGSDVPATTIPSRTRTQITERRDGGQVTEVEVNSSGSHYTMKPNIPPGNAVPGSNANSIRAPQWKVGEFDLSGKRKAAAEAGTNTPVAADMPPPPPPASAEKK